ncbi:MAG TPA: hypothetical protein VGK10_04775 [Prolixibacteraceae bacterium]|jgi:hypothetical protein
MNTIKAVLTGDLIQSRKLDNEGLEKVLHALHTTFDEIQVKVLKKKGDFEIYRGDSFQILIHEPQLALKVALIIKTRLLSLFGDSKIKSDARIAIGIGTIRMHNAKIIESQGEAFEFSGSELDRTIKESMNLSIKSPWEGPNEEFKVNCLFADSIIGSWSAKTAESVFRYLLYGETQEKQAAHFNVSQPAISKRLYTHGNMKAVDAFMKRFENIIDNHLNASSHGN